MKVKLDCTNGAEKEITNNLHQLWRQCDTVSEFRNSLQIVFQHCWPNTRLYSNQSENRKESTSIQELGAVLPSGNGLVVTWCTLLEDPQNKEYVHFYLQAMFKYELSVIVLVEMTLKLRTALQQVSVNGR